MRIAVMQPYFVPYAGYFRLFCAADLVVLFDCVQFLRRGWIHRNRFPNSNNELQWLTLPLEKQPQDVLIKELKFASDHQLEWSNRLRKFDHIFNGADHPLLNSILSLPDEPLNFLVDSLRSTCQTLNLPFQVVLSSELAIPKECKGQERILAIAKHYQATDYINLAGGRELYDTETFRHHGLKLKFLADYVGPYTSILHRVLTEDNAAIARDINQQAKVD